MGRGSSKAGSGSGGGVVGQGDAHVKSATSMVSARESASTEKREAIDGVLNVARDMRNQYGDAGIIDDIQIGKMGGKDGARVIGYYDGKNVGISEKFMNSKQLNAAYDECVREGFHPKRGRKSAAEAVASHEYGHALTDAYARQAGLGDIDSAARRICRNASRTYSQKKSPRSRTSILPISNISGYARTSAAEAVAEAAADVYCNGRKAKVASRYIMDEVNRVLKSGR